MSREIPPLSEYIIKVLARYPVKCMTETACANLLQAQRTGSFRDVDMVHVIVSNIIEAGRMTDDAVSPTIFKNRNTLFLSNSKVSGKYLLQAISFCSKTIVTLDVSGCFQVDDNKLKTVLEQCPNLIEINARNCRKLTDTFLSELTKQNTATILLLNIGGNFNFTDEGVRSFLEAYRPMARVQELVLSGLSVRDDTVLILSKRCKSLKSLGLGYLDLRESTLLEIFAKIGSGLERLDLSWPSTTPVCYNAQPSCVMLIDVLVRYCPNLVDVDVSGNRNFAVADVMELIERKLYAASSEGSRPLEVIRVKFIGSSKNILQDKLSNIYSNLQIVF